MNWFKIDGIEYGWFDMRLGKYAIEVSDFLGYDMPKKFLSKLYRVITEDTEEWLYLMDEPGAEMLCMGRADRKIQFENYQLTVESTALRYDDEARARSKCGSCNYRFVVDIEKALDGIVTEFSLYENGNGRKLYEKHWGPFPDEEFRRLKELAFQMEKDQGETNWLLCNTFLSDQ